MQRISTLSRLLNKFGVGKDGFKDGDLANGITATNLNADWCNGLQEEVISVIEQAGLTPSNATLNQLMTAIATLQRQQTNTAYTTTGTAPAFTVTLPANAVALAALGANLRLRLRFHAAGAGNDTLAIGSLAAKSLKQYDSTGAKVAGVIAAGQLVDVEYDGTDFVLLDPLPSSQAAENWSATITYGLNAKIIGSDGMQYRSIQAANVNHAPTISPAWWIPAQPVTAIVTRNVDASLSPAAPLKHTWNSVKRDVFGMFDTVNNQFVARWTGVYDVSAAVHMTPSVSTACFLHLLGGGGVVTHAASRTGSGGSFSGLTSFVLSTKVFLNAGDAVALYSFLGVSATQNSFNDDDHNYFNFSFSGEK